MKIAILLVLFVTALFAIPSFAQKKKSVSKPKSQTIAKSVAKPTAQLFSVIPFDPNLSSLPSKFNGHDIERVYESIYFPVKSEFETSEQYARRTEHFQDKIIFGQIRPNSVLAFSLKVPENLFWTDLESSYDADKQRMTVSLSGTYYSVIGPRLKSGTNNTVGLELKESLSALGSFIGSNAYGARRRVNVGLQKTYNLAFDNCPLPKDRYGYSGGSISTDFSTTFPLDVSEAVDLKYNLALLFVGRIKSPFVERNAEGTLGGKATITSPTEIRTDNRSVFFDLDEIWIYSYQSGKVITKLQKCSLKGKHSYGSSNFFF